MLVLLIEPDEQRRRLLAWALDERGIAVTPAASALEALQLPKTAAPHIILYNGPPDAAHTDFVARLRRAYPRARLLAACDDGAGASEPAPLHAEHLCADLDRALARRSA